MATIQSSTVAALVPSQPELRVRQTPGKFRTEDLGKIEYLLIVIPEKPAAGLWKQLPDGESLLKLVKKRKLSKGISRTRLTNAAGTGISIQCLPGSGSGQFSSGSFELLSFAGGLAADALRDNPANAGLLVAGFDSNTTEKIVKALVLALSAHRFEMPTFKNDAPARKRLTTIEVLGIVRRFNVKRTLAEAKATNLARWLTSLPPNKLDATRYHGVLKRLSRQHGWKFKFLSEADLKKVGAGAFLAVSQGNAKRDAGIAHLRYTPTVKGAKKSTKPKISLVGKGIIFDTGGTNLKPFNAMLDMHQDMAGSAVALATLIALTELDYPHPVDCWLAITENRIGNKAYKSRDIVTAANGTTIEVIHTDAEGRMALADTLALAGKQSPEIIIDFATLTGTCVSALTERYSGAFTNRPDLHPAIIEAGCASGERVWPFPLDDDFDEEIKSDVADVLQCAAAGGGDHIQAAKFLQRFVPKNLSWVHIDLSAASRKGGLAQVPGEVTGFGARFALSLILDNKISQLKGKRS